MVLGAVCHLSRHSTLPFCLLCRRLHYRIRMIVLAATVRDCRKAGVCRASDYHVRECQADTCHISYKRVAATRLEVVTTQSPCSTPTLPVLIQM